MEDFGILYIVQNTPGIAENALLGYFWHNKEISDTIEESCNHAKENHYCNSGLLRASVNSELYQVMSDVQCLFLRPVNLRRNIL